MTKQIFKTGKVVFVDVQFLDKEIVSCNKQPSVSIKKITKS